MILCRVSGISVIRISVLKIIVDRMVEVGEVSFMMFSVLSFG